MTVDFSLLMPDVEEVKEAPWQPTNLQAPAHDGPRPFDVAYGHWQFPKEMRGQPFTVRPQQKDAVDALALHQDDGNYADVGVGKSLISTLLASYRHKVYATDTWLIIMPPVLIRQWAAWLTQVKKPDGAALKVTSYMGTPDKRAKLSLDADVVLVGIQIFKRDIKRFYADLHHKTLNISIDEAQMLCSTASKQHQVVFEFVQGHLCDLMTGTPANNPMDAYALIKFTNPGKYRSAAHFEMSHVTELDLTGKPLGFKNLDVLNRNLMHASYRVLFEDIYPETETPLYDQISYDLAPDHLKQYQKLVDNHLLEFEDGRMIDATSVSRLFHALGQVPCNYEHFMGKGGTSEALTLLEQKFDELGGKKIVVFAEYKMTMNLIVERLGSRTKVVTINGDTSEAQKGLNIRAFIEDPGVGVVVIHRKSGGAGLDGLQHVCHHMMFLEPIRSPRDFSQCVARLKRTGQTKRVVVWLPTATDTLQVAAVETLLHNDETVNKVVRSIADLRKLLRGG